MASSYLAFLKSDARIIAVLEDISNHHLTEHCHPNVSGSLGKGHVNVKQQDEAKQAPQ